MGSIPGKGSRCLIVGALVGAFLGGCSGDGGTGPATQASVHVVSQNLLHGQACAPATDRCALADRVQLFALQLGDSCPDIAGVQETNAEIVRLLRAAIAHQCGGRYHVAWDGDPGLDREVVLTTGRVLATERFRLAGPLRTALWVRVATAVGAVDFWSTHLASGSDDRPCDKTTCAPPCSVDDDLGTCQARQVGALAGKRRAPGSVLVVAGDLNARPGEPAIAALRASGLVDTHLAAGEPECTSDGRGCTSGRDDSSLTDLRDARSRQSERIDYVFVDQRRGCDVAAPTGLFHAGPDRRGRAGLLHPSDHTGVEATLRCATSAAQRSAGATASVPITTLRPTTTVATGPGDAADIKAAFETVFAGGHGGPGARIEALEDGEALRSVVVAGYEANKAIADRITVRIDAIDRRTSDRADVTFTLLLDGNAVLDHLPGIALREKGRWLVSKRTFCDVGTTGQATVPAPCR